MVASREEELLNIAAIRKKSLKGTASSRVVAPGQGVNRNPQGSGVAQTLPVDKNPQLVPEGVAGNEVQLDTPTPTGVGTAQAAELPVSETYLGTPAGTGGRTPRQAPEQGAIRKTVSNVGIKDPLQADRTYTGPEGETITTHGKGDMSVGRGVGRGSTFAERGMRDPKVGGAVREPKANGPDLNRKIRPPQNIGDMIRYNREVKELERDRGYADKSKRTEGVLGEASARTSLGARKQSAQERQTALSNKLAREDRVSSRDRTKKIESLSAEYSNPNTNQKRKLEIEREIAVTSGKQPTRQRGKEMGMTEKQTAEEGRKRTEFYNEHKQKKPGTGVLGSGFGKEWETELEFYQRRMDDAVAGSQKAPAGQEQTPQQADVSDQVRIDARESVPIGSTWVDPATGRTRTRTN